MFDIEAAFGAFEKRNQPVERIIATADGPKHIFMRGDLTPQALHAAEDLWRKRPDARQQNVEIQNIDSLIEYLRLYRDNDSVVFADVGLQEQDEGALPEPRLITVLDFHKAGGDGAASARNGRDRAIYEFPLSEEWVKWHDNDGTMFPQSDFAHFIEDNIGDIVAEPRSLITAEDGTQHTESRLPNYAREFMQIIGGRCASPREMLELSRDLEVKSRLQAKRAYRPKSGEVTLEYTNEHEQAEATQIPDLFIVAMPVFNDGAIYLVPARFRYRAEGATMRLGYQLYRPDLSFAHAFREAVERVRTETGVVVFYGRPEAGK